VALSAGNEPTIPALHWAITSSGPETINIGAPIRGTLSVPSSNLGNVIGNFSYLESMKLASQSATTTPSEIRLASPFSIISRPFSFSIQPFSMTVSPTLSGLR
jgi:hypothetical protein